MPTAKVSFPVYADARIDAAAHLIPCQRDVYRRDWAGVWGIPLVNETLLLAIQLDELQAWLELRNFDAATWPTDAESAVEQANGLPHLGSVMGLALDVSQRLTAIQVEETEGNEWPYIIDAAALEVRIEDMQNEFLIETRNALRFIVATLPAMQVAS